MHTSINKSGGFEANTPRTYAYTTNTHPHTFLCDRQRESREATYQRKTGRAPLAVSPSFFASLSGVPLRGCTSLFSNTARTATIEKIGLRNAWRRAAESRSERDGALIQGGHRGNPRISSSVLLSRFAIARNLLASGSKYHWRTFEKQRGGFYSRADARGRARISSYFVLAKY